MQQLRCGLLPSVALFLSCPLYAWSTEHTTPLKLNSATVFLQGAELFNQADVALPEGASEVIFTNVAHQLNENSIVIEADNGAIVQSTSVRKDYFDQPQSTQALALEKQLKDARHAKSALNARRKVIQAQLAVLESNRTLACDKTATAMAQIEQMLQLVGNKTDELLTADLQLQERLAEQEKLIERLTIQLDELHEGRDQPVNQIAVKFFTTKAARTHVRLSYAIDNAGWAPGYDIHIKQMGQPVKLGYRASVWQKSGIHWEDVRLRLSTGNPATGAQMPAYGPWYLDAYQEPERRAQKAPLSSARSPAPGMREKREKPSASLADYVRSDTGGLNALFDITLPYSIASDGKTYSVPIAQKVLPGEYHYVAYPRQDTDTFLQVRLKQWQELNLLPGHSTIFFEGSRVGQGKIDPRDAIDGELPLSLGRDRKIIIVRKNVSLTDNNAELFGNSASRRLAWELNVQNTRTEPVNLELVEQVPVSRNTAIKVEEIKHNGASYDKDSGEVRWILELKPGESRKVEFSFTVKYPKDMHLKGL